MKNEVASYTSDSRYNSTNYSSNTPTSLDATASLATSDADIVTIMEEESEEKRQIKEWHKEVFKDIKNNYDCLSREEINRFRVANDKK
jgi:SPX domain protein involved in polyphosphate accumulation